MAVKILSSTFNGINGVMINVEVDITRGLPNFNIVGLGDIAIKESKERVRSAIINSGFDFPISRITVNLAPADIKKEGSLFDLPIAVGILAATGQINYEVIKEYMLIGELSLNGDVNRVKGVLPTIIEGRKNKIKKFIIPLDNAEEGVCIKDAAIYPFKALKEVIHHLNFNDLLPYSIDKNLEKNNRNESIDFNDVVGQESCKRALEVAAAGGHNVVLFGPAGSGKTMLAHRLSTILPDLNYEEALEVTKIYSVSGNLGLNSGLIFKRPFRSPHHSSSKIALIGGGNSLMPGEISLAHHGVLFLDEILEFNKSVLEVLRQPLEERTITISRATGTVAYPSNFMLIAALNPCKCGFFMSGVKPCTCSEYERKRYLSKLSGPLLDRIDIFSYASLPRYSDIISNSVPESSETIRNRVEKARNMQMERYAEENISFNSQMNKAQLKRYCDLDKNLETLMEKFFIRYKLSVRSYTRILKVARTIADLGGREKVSEIDLIEAFQYREFINENVG